jgi:hypothetical protein
MVRHELGKALGFTLLLLIVAGCNPILDQADRDRKEEQLDSVQSDDRAREAITGVEADRSR